MTAAATEEFTTLQQFSFRAFLVSVLGLSLIASACGSSGGGAPGTAAKGSVTVAGFNFAESSILAQIYGGALKNKGYNVTYKLNLGNREVVEPALEKGDISLYPGYAATELEFVNKGKGEATGDPAATTAKLNSYLGAKGLIALNPSPAIDANAFAVSKATATKYNLTKLSDLAPVASQLTLGGPTECPTRPFCAAGLEKVYGLKFKAFKALDAGGPLTKTALKNGDIDIGLVFSSDGAIAANNFVVLKDDKQLESADNVVPVGSSKALPADAQSILNAVSAKLTTEELTAMNKSADIDKVDTDKIAADWLKKYGF